MEPIISLGEYVAYYQPDVAVALWGQGKILPPRAVLDLPFAVWDKLMREPPKPGKAGILPEEAIENG